MTFGNPTRFACGLLVCLCVQVCVPACMYVCVSVCRVSVCLHACVCVCASCAGDAWMHFSITSMDQTIEHCLTFN